ncbi:uncharacterized protein LOC133343002 [Lethenteron reissneri]|uniref:uncharacterized protein LOC133343002 n=1 Tax=Lethenteron reissneri TaxID=7753 RepID=UPI002AB7B437|nr:uncharacterized protein LOC133343002 [Lethenteron reissneri]
MLRRARISVKPNVRPSTGRAGAGIVESGSRDRGGQKAEGAEVAGEAPEATPAAPETQAATSRTPPSRTVETDSERRLPEEAAAAAPATATPAAAVAPTKLIASPAAPVSSTSTTASSVAPIAEAGASTAAASSGLVASTAAAVAPDVLIPLGADNLVASADDNAAAADVVATPAASVDTDADVVTSAAPLTSVTPHSSPSIVAVPPTLAATGAAVPSADLAHSAASNPAAHSPPSAHTVTAPPVAISLLTETISAITPTTTAAASSTAACSAARSQQHATAGDEPMRPGPDSNLLSSSADAFEEATTLSIAAAASARHHRSARAPATAAAAATPSRPDAGKLLPQSRRKRLSAAPIIPRTRAAAHAPVPAGPAKKPPASLPAENGTASKLTAAATVEGPRDPWGLSTSEASGEVSPALPVKPPTGETQYSPVGPSGADAVEAVDHAQEVYERSPMVPDWRVTDSETPGPVTLAQLGVSAQEPASGAVKCAATIGADAETPPVAQSAEVSGAPGSTAALPGRPAEPSRSEISKKLLASLKKSLLKPPALSVKAAPAGADDDDDYDDDSGTAVVTARDGSARPGTAGGAGGGGGGGGGASGTNAGRTQPRPNFKKSSRTVQKTARELAEKTEAKKAARKLAWRTWEQHQSAPDRSQMTMKDLLYWVPRNNPMLRLKSEDGKLLPEKRFDKYPKGDRSAAHGDGGSGGSLELTPPDGPTSPLPPLPPPDCSNDPAPSPSPAAAPAAGVPAPPSDAAAAAASNASVPSTPCAPASSDSPADVSPAAAAAPSLSPAGDAQSLLVPQVRVAEDGSIVLNEDSLMVEVSRTEGLPPVSDCDPIHEYGSHTTYSSFRKSYHAKQWGLLETELFFLAISMVGMDFSMIGQLFPNRSRVDIKNKFKREERCNPRKIDQAFRNKLPLDVSCFETLLQEFERQKTEALNRAPDSKGRRRRKYHPKKTGRRRSDADSDDGDADCWSESGGESGTGAAATETRARTAAQSATERAIGASAATQNGIGTEIRTGTRTVTETQTGTETPTGTATPGTGGSTAVPEPPPPPPAPSGLEEAELLLSLGCEIARGAGAGTGADAGAPAPEPSPELVVESAERRDERSGGDEDIDDEEDFERVKERMLSHPTRSGRRPKPTAFYSTGSAGPGGDTPVKEGGGAAKRPRRREAQDPAAPVRPKPRPSTCARKPPLPPMRPPRRDATDKATVLATRGRGGLVTLRAVLPPEEEEEGRGGGDRASERRHRASCLAAAAATPAPPVRPEHMSCAPAFVPVCLRSPEPQPLTEHMEEQVELSEGDAMLEELVVTCVEEMVVADDDDGLEEEEAAVEEESVDPGSDACGLHVEQNCSVVITDDEHLRVNEAFVYEMMEQAGFGSMQDAYVSSQEGDGGGSAPTMLCFMMCEGGETDAAFQLAGGDGGDAAGAAPEVEHLSLAAVADDQEGQETSTETNNAKSAAMEGGGVPPGDWEGAAPTISDGHMTSWAAPVGAPSPEWPLAAAAEAAPGSPETPDVLPREAPSGASGDLLTPESGLDTVEEEGGSVAEPAEPTVPTVPVSVLTEAAGSGVAVDDGGQADPVQLPATAIAGDAGTVPRPRRPRSDVADGPPAKRHAADTTPGPPEASDVPSREPASDSDELTLELGRGTGKDEAPVAESADPVVSPAPPGSTEAPAADDDGRSDSARPQPTRSAGDAKKGGADVTPPARRARFAKPRPNLAACSARRPAGSAGTAKPAQVGPLGAVK